MYMFENYNDVVNVEELCEMLKVGKNTAYKLINNGDIKSLRIGKTHKIPKSCVITYIMNVN